MHSQIAISLPTMDDVLERHFTNRPDAVALAFGARQWTYRDLQTQADRIAHYLVDHGLAPGDRVAYLGRNSDAIPLLAIGAMRAGIIFVPINWRLAPREIGHIVEDAGCRLAFVTEEFAALEMNAGCEKISAAILTAADTQPLLTPSLPRASAEDIALLLYTSGTTGTPKGVMLSHRSLFGTSFSRQQAALGWDQWDSEDVTLVPIPLAHSGGLSLLLRSFFFGGTAVIQETFEAGEVLRAIAESRISKLGLVPTAIRIVLDHPLCKEVDFSSLKTVIYGAAPISPDLLHDALETFGCEFVQSYGMTETFATCVALSPADHETPQSPRMKSAGRALPGTEIRITDADGNQLLAGDSGEISLRSIAIMTGYWNNPEATVAVLDESGWYRTGDAGYLDDDGYIFIRDRLKDMIISGAENIYPAEVEKILSGHPDIHQVAVIGVPDPHWGEAVKAIVVAVPGRTIDPEDVLAWTRLRIAKFKAPKSLDVVDALPLNASGKIRKSVLRAPYWADLDRAVG